MNADQLELTWHAPSKRWRKRRFTDGKRTDFYLCKGRGKLDRESYEKSLARWRVIEAELEAKKVKTATEQKIEGLKALQKAAGSSRVAEQKSDDERLALVGKNGAPLLTYVVEKEKGHRRCQIDEQFGCLCRRLKITGVSFGKLRDTSTTLIEGIDRNVSDMFGGHKDSRMAIFYIDANRRNLDQLFAGLDAATDKLEAVCGLAIDDSGAAEATPR